LFGNGEDDDPKGEESAQMRDDLKSGEVAQKRK